jgi:hypothetical protein
VGEEGIVARTVPALSHSHTAERLLKVGAAEATGTDPELPRIAKQERPVA